MSAFEHATEGYSRSGKSCCDVWIGLGSSYTIPNEGVKEAYLVKNCQSLAVEVRILHERRVTHFVEGNLNNSVLGIHIIRLLTWRDRQMIMPDPALDFLKRERNTTGERRLGQPVLQGGTRDELVLIEGIEFVAFELGVEQRASGLKHPVAKRRFPIKYRYG